MDVINLKKVKQLRINKLPYSYGKISGIFDPGIHSQLCAECPDIGFIYCEASGEDKTYSMHMRKLFDSRDESIDAADLTPLWADFVLQLLSKEYVMSMSQHAQIDLSKCAVEINCWKYARGGWLSAHTDKPNKVISQLFYMNEFWDESWGGAFCVLNSGRNNDVHEEIFPTSNTSLVLLRSDNSWHSVAPLSCPPGVSRKLVQVIFWRKDNG